MAKGGGGKSINLGELALAISLNTAALVAGLDETKKKLNQHSKDVQNTSKGYDALALAAGVAFWKITDAIGSGVKAFNDFNNSMVGLKSVVQGTGGSFQEAQSFINDFTEDGLINASDAATSLKNLLARGFGLGEASTILNRFKDSAAFGRQASLSLGEAVKGATEGLKNENSVLVDNAGVTKNVSVMWKEYATSIGKSIDSLTTAEKRQAELTGIMNETRFQIGDAAKYANEFAGAQARASAEATKLSQAFGASLAPALGAFLEVITPVISGLAAFVKNNPELVAAITLAGTAFLGIITVVTGVGAAISILTPALVALQVTLSGLMLNPVVLALTALAAVGGLVAVQIIKAKKAQDDYNKAIMEHNRIVKEGIAKTEIASLQEKIDALKKLSSEYDLVNKKLSSIRDQSSGLDKVLNFSVPFYGLLSNNAQRSIDEYNDQIKSLTEQMKAYGVTQENINKVIAEYEAAVKVASRTTALEFADQSKAIAVKQASVVETQNLIKSYKTATAGSKDWYDAQQKLADQFPQFSSASGIEIKAIESITKAQDAAVQAEWTALKAKIVMSKIDLQNTITTKLATLDAIEAQKKANDYLVESLTGKKAAKAPMLNDEVGKARTELRKLQDELNTLDAYSELDINKILGVKPIDDDLDFKLYENKALDSALKIHDHKVKMDQLSKEQELMDLQDILKAYAKSADERMDLEERIFQVKQDIRDKDLQATEKAIEDEAKKLSERTANSEQWISREKSSGNLTGQEEIDAYNRIIKYHKEYLAKIQADTRISADDKKKIIADETKYIQSQQDKIIDIQKSAVEKAINAYIDAKKKQYQKEEDLENDRLSAKLKALDKEYADKENALKVADRTNELNSLYEQERKYQNAATKEGQAKLKDIRDRIADLSREATEDGMQAEKEARQAAIEQEIEDNKKKFAQLNSDLETEKEAMLAASVSYAEKANEILTKGQMTIAGSLANVMRDFDNQTTDMITKGMDKLLTLISEYSSIVSNIKLSPNVQLPGIGSSAVGSSVKQGSNVTINDYGPKYLNGVDDIRDYGSELVYGAENAARG